MPAPAAFYDAGFEFVYFDGTENVHAPFWFTAGWAQQVVLNALKRKPLFTGIPAGGER